MATPLSELAALTDRAWLVGGAVRDELLGRASVDFDLAVDGDARALARGLARATGAHCFALSDAFGAWRVTAADRGWQADLTPLTGATLHDDLANRDLTINAIARPLAGGEAIDPFGGVADLQAQRLAMVSEHSFSADPLRVIRLGRIAVGLGFAIDPATLAAARDAAPGLGRVAGERVFAELKQVISSRRPGDGLALLERLGAISVVLPELEALHDVEQSVYHHRDVHGHTMEVLDRAVALTEDPDAALGFSAPGVPEFLSAPLADELSRADALRWAALLHDIAKPQTREQNDEGRITFFGHDEAGAALAREILGRLKSSERLAAHVAAMTRQHLRLGFLVHEAPLSDRAVYAYLAGTEPVAADVTLLSVADRLATRGRNAERAIDRHLALAQEMLPRALAWHAERPRSPIRGDRLAAALERAPGPWLSAAMAEATEAAYAGEIDPGSEDAVVAHIRAWQAA